MAEQGIGVNSLEKIIHINQKTMKQGLWFMYFCPCILIWTMF